MKGCYSSLQCKSILRVLNPHGVLSPDLCCYRASCFIAIAAGSDTRSWIYTHMGMNIYNSRCYPFIFCINNFYIFVINTNAFPNSNYFSIGNKKVSIKQFVTLSIENISINKKYLFGLEWFVC